ncbi:hypothetical protein Drose_06440 [Dactylosporangium roseum]|uniref:Uncharacterized protein n=1 Tax=Dactylosporangium roseum TaxID=47989 RepID=A0ABY5Z775_9ACTN|nr:hypothetical protein [Dactylosporangium roseum]UWZ37911.1 hypothetical protein Drose_06440 [Dactylosporangium roseum]
MTVEMNYLRAALNVGHGKEREYTRRYQQALDAILNLCEPHDTPTQPGEIQPGSEFGRGYRAGLRALAGSVIAEMQRQIIPDVDEETTS